ncbi:Zinc finger, RING/FYVE/PHD-type [Cordyceps fumosorosea ARSEF 2679]|uniref:E3 ubiquitin-protein ligase listerin n=1 Tax=Cordyceps fumosorosea (strain ARSEF 2679) TaxID=1081104 RepID=A0A167RKW7_CORFA|nr:Zinc finger, RING/FYVE/PHD-type [Cordyceps fumosorosea ARSEF 2679]OAA58694.1 Zinc finger, RING/FYVE/PHD-type [Cordyceps fumosorosea ARSEF 2679]
MKRGQGRSAGGSRPAPGTGFAGFGGQGSGSSLSYLAEPPSFAAIADPNIVVSLKNVLKKDSTTKTKALDDLLAYVQAQPHDKDGGVEDAILDIWTQLYPRASIDNARRVREQSHHLQLELMKSARKRMERHIPKIVGAWLAGLYDRDRAVSRAASDGLGSFLTSPEKADAFWKKCQPQILAFALEAIQETQDILSDERSTTKEDAEAKYFRVINASLSLILRLLQRMEDSDMTRCRDSYDEYFASDSVWKSITLADPSVRRSTCQLLILCLNRKLPYADSVECRQAMITGGLKTTQTGSAEEYLLALAKLTQSHPDIWEASAKSKKPPTARLRAFITKGSQGSRASYWESLDTLLSLLPRSTVTMESESDLLKSLRSGIEYREEPRANAHLGWKCYSNAAQRALKSLNENDACKLAKEHTFPLFENFLFPPASRPLSIDLATLGYIYRALVGSSPAVASIMEEELTKLSTTFCTHLSGSLPSVSKEHQNSQEKVGEEGRRWFQLVKELHQRSKTDNLSELADQPSLTIISQCISLLESRNMKPFGAAKTLEQALRSVPHLFSGDAGVRVSNFLLAAAEDYMDKLVESSSAPILLACLDLCSSIDRLSTLYRSTWRAWVSETMSLPASEKANEVLAGLISQKAASDFALSHQAVQTRILEQATAATDGAGGSRSLLAAAVSSGTFSHDNLLTLARHAVSMLQQKPSNEPLDVLAIIASGSPKILSEDDDLHTSLVTVLLGLSELDGHVSVAGKAAKVRALMDQHTDGKLPTVSIILSNLERATPQSLDIETLVKQAKEASSADVPLEDLLPSTNIWMEQLKPFFQAHINPILSITSPIGGATILSNSSSNVPKNTLRVPRDRRGRSIPARMAIYLSLLTTDGIDLSKLPSQFLVELLYLQCITVQLISDQITLSDTHGIFADLEVEESMREADTVITSLRSFLNKYTAEKEWWVNGQGSSETEIIRELSGLLIQQSKSLSASAVYSARALSELLQATAEAQGWSSSLEEHFVKAEYLKSTPNTVLVSAAILAGFGEPLQASKQINNFCNRLISDVAGAAVDGEKTKSTLSLLTLCSRLYEIGGLPAMNTRIVFAVRQITSWLEEPELIDAETSTEICRALSSLLPCMKGVYGSYWEKTLTFCLDTWRNECEYKVDDMLPLVHASLKLVRVLETISEPNDDLEDALKEFTSDRPSALVEALKLLRDTNSPAAEIVTAVLSREVEKISVRQTPDLGDIYALMASESRDVQTAAFGLLHRAIPSQQEQASVDILLDKTDARLPDELVSLLLDAPTLDSYSDESLAQFPLAIRCYLLSWKLVFDAFSGASFKVRADFTENLKTDNSVSPLLDFTFDVLGHSAAHALNLDKEGLLSEHIYDYDVKLADADTEERSMQWLLVHIYYLVLKYTPGLFRTWYLDCRSKQTRIAVEAWTTKYYSPLIIGDNLDDVQKWAEAQEPPSADEQELQVRVSKPAREVTAGYEVDEALASIVIKVPASYPIEGVTVASLNRVAVTDRKWQSWIMTTQVVITFSNGSIIDGLQVFKRNIVGALRGQSECAICYSIISTDKRMPDKRCTTCKNLFHRTCLYKWFQTSNQNTCPLCRNPIDYLGADSQKRRQ